MHESKAQTSLHKQAVSAEPLLLTYTKYSKTCIKQLLSKRLKIDFQDQISLNAGQKYCKMLQGEHSAILLTFIKLSFVIKVFVLSFLSGRFTQVLLYKYKIRKKLRAKFRPVHVDQMSTCYLIGWFK